MAVITDIADAVAAEINAGSFSQPVSATREYLPAFELADMQTLRVTVVPKSVTTLPGGRAHNQYDYAIDVAVQKKLDAADNTEIDELMTLVDELAEHLRFKRLTDYPNAAWLKTENQPVYAQEHLQELRQFTSILTFTFRLMR
ncbi:hypothetical protein [Thalassoglobus polymorphus]|uniref:DUF3168 domain-containing protein n=1 Tax=Thalassoglobus polymorphus TaxID=2527994 RepID=A0A517QQW0_9PLAN|nr:hypothetical protein [Thalassoglobus polymorphus]QDT33985.1 hypothetical protein Mal48_32420 [Thalassoglobus polymorphus]